MGSLFDGIGGFPLAASRHGIKTLWGSEIEAFPIAVTRLRFPGMIHVGDITKLNGADLPPVDIVTGGSPCQDLSVAGARAGLAGQRSGLFMEQVRVIKEMRQMCYIVEQEEKQAEPQRELPVVIKIVLHHVIRRIRKWWLIWKGGGRRWRTMSWEISMEKQTASMRC